MTEKEIDCEKLEKVKCLIKRYQQLFFLTEYDIEMRIEEYDREDGTILFTNNVSVVNKTNARTIIDCYNLKATIILYEHIFEFSDDELERIIKHEMLHMVIFHNNKASSEVSKQLYENLKKVCESVFEIENENIVRILEGVVFPKTNHTRKQEG